jgi:RNA polymerase sigma-70 factor (ECF subfamily)
MRTTDFERLYSEHAEPLLGFLVYRTGDHALAEDLLADTFERVLRARRSFDRRKASEKTWLYTIALNLLRDNARRSAARSRALVRIAVGDHASSDRREFDAVEQRDSLQEALARLSDAEREVIALRYGADLTVPEISKLTREKLSTVEGRVYRALRKLKNELDGVDWTIT